MLSFAHPHGRNVSMRLLEVVTKSKCLLSLPLVSKQSTAERNEAFCCLIKKFVSFYKMYTRTVCMVEPS